MSRIDAGATSHPTATAADETPWSAVVRRPGSASGRIQSGGSTPSAAAPAAKRAGLVCGPASNAETNTSASAAVPAAVPITDASALIEMQSAIASIADQLSLFGRRFESRCADLEAQVASRIASSADSASESGSESDYSSSESSNSQPSNPRGREYVAVRADCGFCKASERAADANQMPHRFSLHGFEPYDDLKNGRHGGSGTLGTIMGHLEPGVLYFKTGLDGLRTCKASVDRHDPLRADLEAVYNTLNGAFGLINTLRTIVCERAKVVRAGATPGDKKRQQWVESQLNEDDYETADVAPRIRKLKALYDYEAGKADLRKLASTGGASARPGNYEASRKERESGDRGGDDVKRSKSSRRRERKAKREGDGGATGRHKGGGKTRPPKAARQSSDSGGDASDADRKSRRSRAPAQHDGAGYGSGSDKYSGAKGRGGGDQERAGKRAPGGKGSGTKEGRTKGKAAGKGGKPSKGGGKAAKRWGDSESSASDGGSD